jgi:regulator of sigma E protease
MSWVLTILGIVALIVLHELGHFLAAKATGMRVERFSLFFPPRLFGVRRGETEYMVGAIPAGGYVKITGMTPEELEGTRGRESKDARGGSVADGEDERAQGLDPEIVARAYCNQAVWKRVVVILAGPAMNVLIAFVIFWGLLVSANYNADLTLANLNPSVATLVPTTTVIATEKGMPAHGVLRHGDRILAVDGQRAINGHRCAGTLSEGCRATTPVRLTIRRDGRTLTRSVYPRYSAQVDRMLVGFGFGAAPKQFGALAAAGVAGHEMWGITKGLVSGIGHALTSSKARKQVHTIVGIGVIADEAVAAGAGYGLVILAFVSLVLAIVNLFPFLPLDGGHVVWALGEKLRGGRRISAAAMWRYSSVGIILFVFLFINGLSNDISRLAG